jgi:RNA polymerase sigma-70 factor (ECF subfamily)
VDDAGLARLARTGNSEAFGQLVARYALSARRVARAVLHDDDEADDAVQDGILAAWRAIERFDPARPFRPWLMRIVVNAALDLRRRDKVRRTEAIPDSAESKRPGPDRATDAVILGARLRQALAELPERQRVAVVLFDAEGYSHAEIAALLEVPEGTVRSYVFHGRRALRRILEPIKEELR